MIPYDIMISHSVVFVRLYLNKITQMEDYFTFDNVYLMLGYGVCECMFICILYIYIYRHM